MKLFKSIRSYNTFKLKVDRRHALFVEESGNKDGIPTLCLHGGPGAPMGDHYRRFMNPKKFRIISFHQRGCGKSTPFGCLTRNKTKYLIQDMEKIRKHLGIKKWIVEGGSWGATLAVLYAIKHPKRVRGLIAFGVSLFNEHMEASTRFMAPDLHHKWSLGKKSDLATMKYYLKGLRSKNKKTRTKFTKLWQMEDSLFKMMDFPSILPKKRKKSWFSPKIQYTLALLECYYYMHGAFVPKNYILKNAHKLNKIPGFILHGRYDIICTPLSAFKLSKVWTKAKLCINPMAGHGIFDKSNAESMLKAYKFFERK